VNGAFVLQAGPGAQVAVKDMRVDNQGWEWQELGEGAASEPEELRIRGFRVIKRAATKYMFGQAGQYTLPQERPGGWLLEQAAAGRALELRGPCRSPPQPDGPCCCCSPPQPQPPNPQPPLRPAGNNEVYGVDPYYEGRPGAGGDGGADAGGGAADSGPAIGLGDQVAAIGL
jgi:hypothetical protein